MSNKYNKSNYKTEESSTPISKVFPLAQANNFLFTSKSPSTKNSKIKKEKVDISKNWNRQNFTNLQKNVKYSQNFTKKSQISSYNQNRYKRMTEKKERNPKSFQEKSFQAPKNTNHSTYFSEISSVRYTEPEQEKKNIYKSNYKLKQPTSYTSNEKNDRHMTVYSTISNYDNLTNNNNRNRYSNNNSNIFNYKERKTTTHITSLRYNRDKKINDSIEQKEYSNMSYQGNKSPPKFYRNNPLIRNKNENENEKKNVNINNVQPVAQKICNIVIKGRNANKKDENTVKNDRSNNQKAKVHHIYKNYGKKKEIEYEDENDDKLNK